VVRNFEGHTNHVLAVAWNRTGRAIATAGADDVVKVWDAATGQQTKTIPGFAKQATKLRYVAFDANFVVAAGGAPLRLVQEGGNIARNYDSGQEFMYTVAISGDGQTLAAGSLDGVLRLWTAGTGAPIAVLPTPK
jgi:WD40 repeat protein